MNNYILAIETSCDETAMAIIDSQQQILAHVLVSQINEFESLGGVVPEMASRFHEQEIFKVYQEVLKKAKKTITQIDAIAVTYGPGLIGSLLVGINFANSLSLIYGIKLVPVNHMQAHIYSLKLENNFTFPLLSLIISGGHTELVLSTKSLEFTLLGSTLDDAIGESYDKIARLLDLGYPGGPLIEQLAKLGKPGLMLPLAKHDQSLDFSFSGLKSATYNLVNQAKMKNVELSPEDVAYAFEKSIIKTILYKLRLATSRNKYQSLGIVGGVSANQTIIRAITENFDDVIVPQIEYATDNAAMIAIIGLELFNQNIFTKKFLNAKPNLIVEDKWNN